MGLGTIWWVWVGVFITFLHSRRSALRNWLFQVSQDGHDWITLATHDNDTTLGDPG